MFCRTERLLLRPGWAEDAPALYSAIDDHAIVGKLSRAPWPYAMKDAEDFLSQPWNPREPRLLAFSRTRGSPRLVGGCSIHKLEDGRHEIGYWIARPFWGLGFATEAASAMMRIARSTGLGKVIARRAIDNPASGRVLTKIGFRPTGRTEAVYSTGRGCEVDSFVYEDGGTVPMRTDLSHKLYMDRAPIAA